MVALAACCVVPTFSFAPLASRHVARSSAFCVDASAGGDDSNMNERHLGTGVGRRSALQAASTLLPAALLGSIALNLPTPVSALGTLPETAAQTRAIAQAVVQLPAGMTPTAVSFFTKSLFAEVLQGPMLRDDGSVVTTIGFGPQEYAVPASFVPGVSAFTDYGSHFSLQLIAPPLAVERSSNNVGAAGAVTSASTPTPGDGVAYIALGVPQYRVSKLIEYGGDIKSSYGFTVVDAPGGLPLHVVLGDQVSLKALKRCSRRVPSDLGRRGASSFELVLQQRRSPHSSQASHTPMPTTRCATLSCSSPST